MVVRWNAENAAHLLRRAGFGPTPEQITTAVADGMDRTIAKLFVPDANPATLPGSVVLPPQLSGWWVHRMVTTTSPL